MLSEQHVLVVDGITETEEVLKTVLEPRGLHVNRIVSSIQPKAYHKFSTPNVVVLHEDSLDTFQQDRDSWNQCSKVIIGRAELPQRSHSSFNQDSTYIPAPFQYKELILAIEHFLEE